MSTYLMSNDGEAWYEVPEAKFLDLLKDKDADCWLDMSAMDGYKSVGLMHIRLSVFRQIIKKVATEPDARPTELYGIPIVYED